MIYEAVGNCFGESSILTYDKEKKNFLFRKCQSKEKS